MTSRLDTQDPNPDRTGARMTIAIVDRPSAGKGLKYITEDELVMLQETAVSGKAIRIPLRGPRINVFSTVAQHFDRTPFKFHGRTDHDYVIAWLEPR